MYRVLLLLVILNVAEPYYWGNGHSNYCQRHHNDYRKGHIERALEYLVSNLINTDNKVKSFCTEDQETKYKEGYGKGVYKYITTLPNFNESTIAVKIKHRVLYVKAVRDTEFKEYTNVKILPESLNTTAASWRYRDGELTVAVPYKEAVKTGAFVTCGDAINTTLINVPKYEPSNEHPDIDVWVTFDDYENDVNATDIF